MAVSKAQQASVNKYVKSNYDRINVTMPKGEKEVIQGCAAAQGESVNGFIVRAVRERMERDSGGIPSETAGGPQEAASAAAVIGGISLPPDALEAAQRAAERTGEAVEEFVARAVKLQDERDSSPDNLEGPEGFTLMDAALKAAETTGETPVSFLSRAIQAQAKRDKSSIALGINPATGDKLDSKGGADHE